MRNPLIFLITTLADLYLLAFLLRFILQWIRADFYSPFAQAIVKITNPLILPVRRVVPSSRNVDLPTLVVLIVLQTIVTSVILSIAGITIALFQLPLLVWEDERFPRGVSGSQAVSVVSRAVVLQSPPHRRLGNHGARQQNFCRGKTN